MKDPREVVKAGDIVKVRVVEVDLQRKRIALSRRLEETASAGRGPREDRGSAGGNRGGASPRDVNRYSNSGSGGGGGGGGRGSSAPAGNSAMADAFARAKRGG